MIDLRPETEALWRSMSRMTASSGAPVVLFIAARAGEGVSSIAASVALHAASRANRAAWLVDLDLKGNAQHAAFEKGFTEDVGRPGKALDASLGQAPIYDVVGGEDDTPQRLLAAHRIGEANLLVTQFRTWKLPPGARLRLKSQPRWWAALRKAADWVIVDAPALERSSAGLVAAGQADGVVIVTRADSTTSAEVSALQAEIEAHGGRALGAILNAERRDARFFGGVLV